VGRIVAVTKPAGRGVGQHHIDGPPVPQPPPGSESEAVGPPALLTRCVLVGPGPVADAAPEAGEAQPGGVDDAAVGIDRPVRPRRPGNEARPYDEAVGRRLVAGDVGIVVAGHKDEGGSGGLGQPAEALERDVAAADDQVGSEAPDLWAPQPLVHLVGDGQHAHAPTLQLRRRDR
jgi:hypothetical protein